MPAPSEQKSRKIYISDFGALAEPADFTILAGENKFLAELRQAQNNRVNKGYLEDA